MPLHSYESADAIGAAHDTCGHHHDHQNEEPQKSDDCGLCNLAILPADLPAALNVPAALYILSDIQEDSYDYADATTQRNYQARAPPFMAV